MLNEVKPARAEQAQARRALGRYQHARRMVFAALVVVMFAALLFGQSAFPPESVPHELLRSVRKAGTKFVTLANALCKRPPEVDSFSSLKDTVARFGPTLVPKGGLVEP